MQFNTPVWFPLRARGTPWVAGAAYVLGFLFLDWVSYIRPFLGLNITPWNPQPALAIALLIWSPRWIWLVWIGVLAADLIVRGPSGSWLGLLTGTAALSLTYAAIARALRQKMTPSLPMGNRRDLLWFLGIVTAGALASGVVYVTAFAVAELGLGVTWHEAVARYWIGDAVGILVTLPMLLLLMDGRGRARLYASASGRQWWPIALVICFLVWLVAGQPFSDQSRYFYLLLLPVVWASARLGVAGAVLASGLTQLGLIVAVQSVPNPDLTVFELQALMAVITLSGLVLGVAVDERSRAEADLRGSLRFAAAGQMSAALAHELSQPLTALSGYAQVCRQLVRSAPAVVPDREERLMDISRKMVEDANRASEVVKRLRDFFQTGTTQLTRVSPAAVLYEALKAQSRRADALAIRLEAGGGLDGELPAIWMDPVQIGVVLRNLLANAMDASALSPAGTRRVGLDVEPRPGEVVIRVTDSGPGIQSARLPGLFDATASDKPGGMGVGLGICRAIVEAHGGCLWAEPGSHGQFCFALPADDPEPQESRNAQ